VIEVKVAERDGHGLHTIEQGRVDVQRAETRSGVEY
jgi:hypothetical protein